MRMVNDYEEEDEEMLPEYEFSNGIRGKYSERFRAGYAVHIHHEDGTVEEKVFPPEHGVVVLDPDLRSHFPDSASVNAALRGLLAQR